MSYSHNKFQISKADISDVVTRSGIAGLNGDEERIIEDTILRVRGSDERISLFEIDQALRALERKHTISKFDREFVLKAMEKYNE